MRQSTEHPAQLHHHRRGGRLGHPRGRALRHADHSESRLGSQARKAGAHRHQGPLQHQLKRHGQLSAHGKVDGAQADAARLHRRRHHTHHRPGHAAPAGRRQPAGDGRGGGLQAAGQGRCRQDSLQCGRRPRGQHQHSDRDAQEGAHGDCRRAGQHTGQRQQLVQNLCERQAQQHDDQEPQGGAQEHACVEHQENRGDNQPWPEIRCRGRGRHP